MSSVVICPWCQSEIVQEEGQEPDKVCPVCDNELDGYRTLQVHLGEEEDDERFADDERYVSIDDDDDIDWMDDETEPSEEMARYEENAERLLDEQDYVPECPSCREYMLEAGERTISADGFIPRLSDVTAGAMLEAPVKLSTYVCPSCFAVQDFLGDSDRHRLIRKLSEPSPDLDR
ncbi:hypothetical protein ACF3MZ_01515 [Paenibacillaceae bacterium WGS1546]|uniref:hypothetical protein n=1 Tax=Cohnella sp. WGS1546 TaxID=3366810 RepID=UPI00372D0909